LRRQPSRANQNWIFDNFLKLSDNEDVLHPGILGIRYFRGFKHQDLEAVYQRITGRRSIPRLWARQASVQEEKGAKALKANRIQSAAGHYHRAGLCFGRAQHLIPVDGHPKKKEYYEGLQRCYGKFREIHGGHITKHQAEFEDGKNTYFYFWPAEGDGPKPTVLLIPGMDMVKEDALADPWQNVFHQRGMNVCAMDGPGHGECNMNQVWVDQTNFAKAGSKVIDFLCERDDVDSSKIGLFGQSMGSRWTVEIAAHDDRVNTVIGQMANVGPSDIIFNHAQPNFRRIYMYMSNILDDDKFDEFVEERDSIWHGVAEKMKANYLLVAGDMDELCSPDDIHEFLDVLNCPKELWLYEGIFHPMGEVAADMYPAIADWMLDTLNNGLSSGHDNRIVVPEG
tara:strand:+ start:22505 stop:23692 length:1188 start_codon:yes stop_codon:yes gene_type:complete